MSMLAASHTVRPAAALDCEIKVVAHDSSQWESIRPIWSELVEASKCSFFVTAEWIETWLEVFGSHLDPSILIVERLGQPIGACLLVMRRPARGFLSIRRMSMNASGEPASDTTYVEFNDILSRAGWEGPVAEAVVEFLKAQQWDELTLEGFTMGPAYESFKTAFPTLLTGETVHTCHYVDLAAIRESGKAYESVLKGKALKHLRQNRRYYSESGPIELQVAKDLTGAFAMFDELAELSKARCVGKRRWPIFSSPRFVAFHRALIRRCLHQGTVQLLRVSAGKETIGILYNLVLRGKVYFYQCGYGYSTDARLSPGKVALSQTIQYCLDAGYDEFDFLSGGAKYKQWMSTGSRTLAWVTFRKRAARVWLLSAFGRIKASVKLT